MDLGFARRRASRSTSTATLELASLLAEVAARQAVSPTAQANALAERDRDHLVSRHPEIERFAPRADRQQIANNVSSFSPDAADVIVTLGKAL
jgi:hypothetical protein